ncbi:helix-turn-helix transcriptional regulator [Chelatococcus sp.]|uniref:helix-turn-helix transcriptional regulator n=1 Tax=Chelatococcus sp. TaxID=1953771 RepID=UPI001EC71AAC|nr:helix-turn-helix transcriptional regulator [Chelatococcus sp.]MBX3547431.1 helix-turn-helix transcriptional regulator [Chelatococcus sp.]
MIEDTDREAAELGEIIDAAALDITRWADVAEALHARFPGSKVVLQTRDDASPGTNPVILRGWDDRDIDIYVAYYARLNPWAALMANLPLMIPIWTENTLPAKAFAKTEFYTDWLMKVEGGAECATSLKLFQDRGRNATLDIHYGGRYVESHHRHATRLLTDLAPRLQRSLAAGRLRSRIETARPPLETFRDAAFLVDYACRLQDTNAAAQRLLEQETAFLLPGSGRLSLVRNNEDRELLHRVAAVCNPLSMNQIRSFRRFSAVGSTSVSILPLVGHSNRGVAGLFPPDRKAIVIVRPFAIDGGSPTDLARFRLTVAETRLVEVLLRGRSLANAALELDIAYETARTHLRAVFAKTGTHRQAELLALILSGREA